MGGTYTSARGPRIRRIHPDCSTVVLLIMSEDRNAKYRAKYEEQWHNFSTLKRERSCVGNKRIVGSDGDVTRTSGPTPVPH